MSCTDENDDLHFREKKRSRNAAVVNEWRPRTRSRKLAAQVKLLEKDNPNDPIDGLLKEINQKENLTPNNVDHLLENPALSTSSAKISHGNFCTLMENEGPYNSSDHNDSRLTKHHHSLSDIESSLMPQQEMETVPITSHPYNGPRISLSLNMQQIFEEQMRKHVQLLTQTHLIAVQQVGLSSQARRCRSMLNELLPISQSFDITNIQEAVQLVNYWESVAVKIPQDEIFSGGNNRTQNVKRSNTHHDRYWFHPQLVELMAQSRVFIYPSLLPKLDILEANPLPDTSVASKHEEQLIAMGMEQFIPYFKELYPSLSQSQLMNKVSAEIAQHILPHWTPTQIKNRINRLSSKKEPNNPVKYYKENNTAPPINHSLVPFNHNSVPKLSDVDASLLPERWRLIIQKRNRLIDKYVNGARPKVLRKNTRRSIPVSSSKAMRQLMPKTSAPNETVSSMAPTRPQQVFGGEFYYIFLPNYHQPISISPAAAIETRTENSSIDLMKKPESGERSFSDQELFSSSPIEGGDVGSRVAGGEEDESESRKEEEIGAQTKKREAVDNSYGEGFHGWEPVNDCQAMTVEEVFDNDLDSEDLEFTKNSLRDRILKLSTKKNIRAAGGEVDGSEGRKEEEDDFVAETEKRKVVDNSYGEDFHGWEPANDGQAVTVEEVFDYDSDFEDLEFTKNNFRDRILELSNKKKTLQCDLAYLRLDQSELEFTMQFNEESIRLKKYDLDLLEEKLVSLRQIKKELTVPLDTSLILMEDKWIYSPDNTESVQSVAVIKEKSSDPDLLSLEHQKVQEYSVTLYTGPYPEENEKMIITELPAVEEDSNFSVQEVVTTRKIYGTRSRSSLKRKRYSNLN